MVGKHIHTIEKQGWCELDSLRIARVKLEQVKRISKLGENNGEQYTANQSFPVWTRRNKIKTAVFFSWVYVQSLSKFEMNTFMHSVVFISLINTFDSVV